MALITRNFGPSSGGRGVAVLTAQVSAEPSVGGTIQSRIPRCYMGHSPIEFRTVSLVSGANTIDIPDGAVFVIMTPPDGNATSLSIGSWGLDPNAPTIISVTSGTGRTRQITAGGAISGVTLEFY